MEQEADAPAFGKARLDVVGVPFRFEFQCCAICFLRSPSQCKEKARYSALLRAYGSAKVVAWLWLRKLLEET
jgi:hypothetical protein